MGWLGTKRGIHLLTDSSKGDKTLAWTSMSNYSQALLITVSLLRSMVIRDDRVAVAKVRDADLLKTVPVDLVAELKVPVDLLLNKSKRGALSQAASLAMVIDTLKLP